MLFKKPAPVVVEEPEETSAFGKALRRLQGSPTRAAMAATYVGSLYLLPRRLTILHRDHPAHVRGRFCAVTVASVAAPEIDQWVRTQWVCARISGGAHAAVGCAASRCTRRYIPVTAARCCKVRLYHFQ